MAIRDTFVYPIAVGDQLNDGYFNGVVENAFKIESSDNTGGSHSGDTAETTVVTRTIPANTVTNGILITAPITFQNNDSAGGSHTGTFRLKVAGSTVKTITLTSDDASGSGSDATTVGTCFAHFDNSATWTGSVVVSITAQNTDTENVSTVHSFIIQYL